MLILNPENWRNADRLHFEFANSVYITLYNPNFVVFYIGIILPITIYLCFTSKGIIKKNTICSRVHCRDSLPGRGKYHNRMDGSRYHVIDRNTGSVEPPQKEFSYRWDSISITADHYWNHCYEQSCISGNS